MGEARRRRLASLWVRVVSMSDVRSAAHKGDYDALSLIPLIDLFEREAKAAGEPPACLLCAEPAAHSRQTGILGIISADRANPLRAFVTPICDRCAIEAGAGIGKATHAAYWARLYPVVGHA